MYTAMYRYCSVSPREGKCIHLYRDTLVRYIGIQHTYTSMKPNETAIHQMYRTSIQLYIFPHVVTEPQYRDTVIQRDTAIQRYNAIHRYTCISYHHPSDSYGHRERVAHVLAHVRPSSASGKGAMSSSRNAAGLRRAEPLPVRTWSPSIVVFREQHSSTRPHNVTQGPRVM